MKTKKYTSEEKLQFWIAKREFASNKIAEYEEILKNGEPIKSDRDLQLDRLNARLDAIILKIGLVEDKVDFGK